MTPSPLARRATSARLPLTIAAVLAATATTVTQLAPVLTTRAEASTAPQARELVAERARAAAITSSRTAARAALAHPSTSRSPFAYIDPRRTPSVPAALTGVVATDSRATAQAKVRLADAVRRMAATERSYRAAAAAASQAASALTDQQAGLLRPAAARPATSRPVAAGRTTTRTPARTAGDADLQTRAASARQRELVAADAHRESIDAVLRLRGTVVAAVARDTAARRAAEDVLIAQGTLVRLADGTTVPAVPLGTPIPGNGWTMTPAVRGWITEALPVLYAGGMPRGRDDMMLLATIVYNESGGDPAVHNDWDSNAASGTPSFGLMQTIAPTFAAYAVAGRTDPRVPANQIVAGTRYALDRYGSLSNVPGVRSLAAGGRYLPY